MALTLHKYLDELGKITLEIFLLWRNVMKRFYLAILFLGCFSVVAPNSVCRAGVDLPWSTTYDCPDWLAYSDPLNCDGLSKAGGQTQCGHYEEIIVEANNPLGSGKGQRHYVGDDVNQNSGGIMIDFNSLQSELWVRFYIRYEAGFAWSPYLMYDKLIYLWLGDGSDIHAACIPSWYNNDNFNLAAQAINGGVNYYSEGTGWTNTMGGATSDGKWHCIEVHMKMDTNGTDGVGEAWIDNVKILDRHDLDWDGPTHTGFRNCLIGSNQRFPSNGRCMAVDYDDVSISNTGRIGPIGGGGPGPDTISPSVSIVSPTSGQTVSGNVSISASASDNVGVAGVQFKIDGTNIGSEDTTSPYSYSLDTTTYSDGSHTLTATARDAAGNQATSSQVSISINNGGDGGGVTLFDESFEDANFTSRGWYDNTNLQLSTTEHIPGSTSSVEFHFLQGATTPTSGTASRKIFSDTDEVYVSYYVKYSANWEGSNKSYHPHEFLILTNKNGIWDGPAYTHLTVYVEQNEGIPLLGIQDGQNIDETQVGIDLANITENRAVAGCNGDSDGYGDGTCYPSGSVHWNGKLWRAGSVYFQDTPGAYYKNDWHHVEAYFKLNSISGGKAIADGQLKYWFDGNIIINHNDVVLRTGQHPDMKFNQFLIAPWIGDGSPVDQTMWIDELTVATGRSVDILTPPSGLQITPQ
ncbi:MAG: hypothetical protein HF978_04795 [Desulfobacteraceae bacterium]|nr:hypothetical protein [Desulfobacteraceae bacterium]MBC2754847.1 hypothetical protein [Desulfobacteraceae bacterium]